MTLTRYIQGPSVVTEHRRDRAQPSQALTSISGLLCGGQGSEAARTGRLRYAVPELTLAA